MLRRILVTAVLVSACGGGGGTPGSLRFHNRPVVWLVNDRQPIPPIEKAGQGLVVYYLDQDLIAPSRLALTVDDERRAANVNSLGEVPDSSWFTNRSPTPAEVRRGPGRGGPDRSGPFRVTGVKVGGVAIGITVLDARGDRYVLKFDERGHAETETSADVVVQRLSWACGYNVPENEVVTFARGDLTLDPAAVMSHRAGGARPMTERDLETYLALVESDGGRFRALASRFIDGKILGGVEPEGKRAEDPNDRVPHELRRDLRGQRMLWAWVNHPDLKTANTLATVTDESYVKRYVLDFGKALGTWSRIEHQLGFGYRRRFGLHDAILSLVSLGIWVRDAERWIAFPAYRGLGYFDAESFDPATWVPNHRWRPTDLADRFDELWAAAILLRLTRQHIEAAVAAGSYSDPRTADFLVRTLIARQRKVGNYALSRVAPLTALVAEPRAQSLAVCFDDLWLRHGLNTPDSVTTYRATGHNYDGSPTAVPGPWVVAHGAHSCVTVPPGSAHERYTISRIEVRRDKTSLPPVFVHAAIGPAGWRVIGIDRR
ncbi:MAG: hypothetical protein WKG01_30355 [Kofleriaceae bacterium]